MTERSTKSVPECDAEFSNCVALVINYNTSRLTVRCVSSLLMTGLHNILVLDNASNTEDVSYLRDALTIHTTQVRLVESKHNHGFAAGSNLLIELAMQNEAFRFVLLLNNDAVGIPQGLSEMLRTAVSGSADLVGGRVLSFIEVDSDTPSLVDSLGITLYRPLLASNRKSTDERFLGPTGGCAIYSRRLLAELKALHGHVFDPDFFCYAEDTDLCIRARLLGYTSSYVDTPVAMHDGQASSGGGFSDFVLYHGIRNSIWVVLKSIPMSIIIRQLPWIVVLHLGIIFRHSLRGKGRVIWRLYRDALRGVQRMLGKRKIIQSTRRIPASGFNQFITQKFYESSFLKMALRELFFLRRGK